ncbi:MAG: RNA-binding S4 domain-containing protein [Phycisphaerales bacterium]|nr:RNA-binding S4 domain-containing protein [Phycisphaerales bacterium]
MESTRIDRWLVAVRLIKTRKAAADACGGGKVRLNGGPVKPSTAVKVGDRVEARINKRERIVEVVRIIEKRVGAPVARECYEDHSPPPEPSHRQPPPMQREPGSGRPTKRDRRMLDRLRRG